MRPLHTALFFLIFASGAALAPSSLAQIPPSSSTTSTPVPGAGHDYLGGPVETVNPVSGSVSIRVPVIMPPGRGITLPFTFAYDSNGVNYLSGNGNVLAPWRTSNSIVSSAGWSNTAPTMSLSVLLWHTQGNSALIGAPNSLVSPAMHRLHKLRFSGPQGRSPQSRPHDLQRPRWNRGVHLQHQRLALWFPRTGSFAGRRRPHPGNPAE